MDTLKSVFKSDDINVTSDDIKNYDYKGKFHNIAQWIEKIIKLLITIFLVFGVVLVIVVNIMYGKQTGAKTEKK
jgi:hypothetical protein